MVSKKTNRRKTVKNTDAESKTISAALATIFTITLVLVIYYIVAGIVYINTVSTETVIESPETVNMKPEKIDFQPVIDEWAKNTGGNKSVLFYDLDRDEAAGEYNVDKKYDTASLYKLFVVYEGYRKLETGEWQATDKVGGAGHTILECLDLAIRESNSDCAESLWVMIGYDELEEIVEEDFDIHETSVEGLASNVNDIAKIMKLFYKHPDIKDTALISRMQDAFLNQPKTEYNWRQGLPSGFSDAVKVYNKVGWSYNDEDEIWDVYHDAAIVEFPEKDRHFVVVVMTSKVPYQQIRKLGTMIETEFNKY